MIYSEELIKTIKDQTSLETKFLAVNRYIDVKLKLENNRIFFYHRYNKDLIDIIKTSMVDRKYHGFIENDNRKVWSAPINYHNLFQIEVLRGKYGSNPYKHWKTEPNKNRETILNFFKEKQIEPFNHQIEMIDHALQTRWCLWAAEMGLGKTLCSLAVAKLANAQKVFYVGPKSAIIAAKVELIKWNFQLNINLMTYDKLKAKITNWDEIVPDCIILDESSLLMNGQSQRTKATAYLADNIRNSYALEKSIIIEMTGTPQPKKPINWYSQAEIACPGFLYEDSIYTISNNLGVFEKQESVEGVGFYPKLITWRDNENKCNVCGVHKDDHSMSHHTFVPSINQVAKLGNRLGGLVTIHLKKDCLDLPEKVYEEFKVEPTLQMMQNAELIINSTDRAVDALIKLRTLSDGFLYKHVGTGKFKECEGCYGNKQIIEYYFMDENNVEVTPTMYEIENSCIFVYNYETEDGIPEIVATKPIKFLERFITCPHCKGTGQVEILNKETILTETPKDQVFLDLLDKHDEVGRFVTYGCFHGTVDKLESLALDKGWSTIKADGRGWTMKDETGAELALKKEDMLIAFADPTYNAKIIFIGQPGAAGMGLTLTASPGIFFYSNDFIPVNRQQAEDRGHRIGMDKEKGGRIYDVVCLPIDKKIIESLRGSKDLQRMSLDGLKTFWNSNK